MKIESILWLFFFRPQTQLCSSLQKLQVNSVIHKAYDFFLNLVQQLLAFYLPFI